MKRSLHSLAAMAVLMAQQQQRPVLANRMGVPGGMQRQQQHKPAESATIAPSVAPTPHEYFLGPS